MSAYPTAGGVRQVLAAPYFREFALGRLDERCPPAVLLDVVLSLTLRVGVFG